MAEVELDDRPEGAELPDPLEMPPLCPGIMAESKPFPASGAHNEALGFPGELVENWQERAIDKMGELLGK
ncbi:MAG: (Fe-S)-binding protein, partial [Hyphomicrobiales bacterium]|nr:(Fe-S)-binding protein [Hyphomicrobiales bacterium]